MKKVYIVLTYTGTILSKLVKGYTNDDYAHVSIALDKELKEMYSFGRLNPYIPFIGGFVHESVDRGTFKRFYKTKTKIYSLEVNEEQFIKICNIIKEFNENRHSYKFNVLGLFFAAINLNIKREKCFYCASFLLLFLSVTLKISIFAIDNSVSLIKLMQGKASFATPKETENNRTTNRDEASHQVRPTHREH